MTFKWDVFTSQRRKPRHIDITDDSDTEIDGKSKSFEGVHWSYVEWSIEIGWIYLRMLWGYYMCYDVTAMDWALRIISPGSSWSKEISGLEEKTWQT